MLSEEAFVLVVALVAVALLILGVLELIAPTRPRYAQRPQPERPQPPAFVRDPWRRARRPAVAVRRSMLPRRTAADAQGGLVAPLPVLPPEARGEAWTPSEPVIDFPLSGVREPASEYTVEHREEVPPEAVPETPATESEPLAAPKIDAEPQGAAAPERIAERDFQAGPEREEPGPGAASVSEPAAPVSPVEHCYVLYEAQRFDEVVAAGMSALETASSDPRVREPEEVARLWGVVGLARQALGDPDAAREAFAEAITAAPDGERAAWERYLTALVLEVARDLQARAGDPHAGGPEERVAAMRSSISWLEGGLAQAPDDGTLREATRSAHDAIWSTYEQVAMEQMQRQDYDGAQRLLQEALDQADCPADFQATFRELLSGTHGGAVGQLTAEALRRMREGAEREALAALDRAEALLATIPEDGLPDRRRQELERRLWWSYTKVGIRWLEGGMYEQAVPPLLHALRFASVGAQRLDETRRPLARAVGGLVEDRSPLIQRLIETADRPEARALCETLWAHVQDALDAGMTEEDLGEPLKRLHELRERLDEGA